MIKAKERNLKPHKNLKAWQTAKELAIAVYRATENFPSQEKFGLALQMRRAAVSAPSNIAEGAAGRTPAQLSNFLSTAIGSLNERDTQLEIAFQLGYMPNDTGAELQRLLDRATSLTYGLKRSASSRQRGTQTIEGNE
jgi:four helix bundle protein